MTTPRIDSITFHLSVFDDINGRREIVFHVDQPAQDSALIAEVRKAWQAWYDELLRVAQESGPVDGFPWFT